MLDIDTLNALSDLMAKTLYSAEVARLPKLTRAEEAALVRRARAGDAAARAALIVSCLHYALGKARHYYHTRRPAHDDELDLAQVASLEMVADLDVALTKRSPVPYLRGIAARAMSIYLSYRSSFIRKPNQFSGEQLATTEFPTVESLDVLAHRKSARLKVEIISLEEDAARTQRFAPLYEALQRLTPKQRNAVVRRYRLGDELLDPSVTPPKGVHTETLQKLRKALEGHLKQMLSPEQE